MAVSIPFTNGDNDADYGNDDANDMNDTEGEIIAYYIHLNAIFNKYSHLTLCCDINAVNMTAYSTGSEDGASDCNVEQDVVVDAGDRPIQIPLSTHHVVCIPGKFDGAVMVTATPHSMAYSPLMSRLPNVYYSLAILLAFMCAIVIFYLQSLTDMNDLRGAFNEHIISPITEHGKIISDDYFGAGGRGNRE